MDNFFFYSDRTIFQIESKKKDEIVVHISGSPTVSSIEKFSQSMKESGVTDVFCFCKLSYDPKILEKYCISFHHLEFDDGMYPDDTTIKIFNSKIRKIIDNAKNNSQIPHVNMHCQAGMGRAPTFLAYLMITKYDWNNGESIDYIRKLRRGSFNKTQLNWVNRLKSPSTKTQCILL